MARPSSFTLPVGALLSTSVGHFFRNLVPFALLGALILSPWIAFHVWSVNRPMPSRPEVADILLVVLIQLAGLLLQILLGYVLTGAVTYGVVQQLRGQPTSFAATIAKGLQVFGRTLAVGVVCGLRICLYCLLLVVPGIMEAMRLYVAIPVAVIEGTDVGKSIERSKALTDGSRWQVFASWLILLVLGWVVGALLVFVATMLGPRTTPAAPVLIGIQVASAVLLTTFGATVAAVCYSMLRHGKENVDVKEIAAVFA